jgi:competence protein ComEC
LRRRGVRRLDVVVAAHGQDDHAAGLVRVVRELPVGELWLPLGSRDDPQIRPVVLAALERGVRVVPGPDADLAGRERAMLPSENDRSVAIIVAWRGLGVLLPGDVEADGEALVADAVARLSTRIVAAAIPHHGARSSSSRNLIDAARPAIAVAQAGRFSRFKHPHPSVVARWAGAGARVWQTGRDGAVELTIRERAATVRTWRWDRGWRTEATVPIATDPWRAAGPPADAPPGGP